MKYGNQYDIICTLHLSLVPEGENTLGTFEILTGELREYKKLKLISELVLIRERIKLFENKYDTNFKNFEKAIKQHTEDFQTWDDYIEWKAYQRKFDEIKDKLGELKSGKDITTTR